ncbi:MAG: DUF5939 domain-containing protein [Polyangiaceae bacterium]
MSDIEVERSIECKSPADRLWPIITDTERMNRAIGLGRIEVEPNTDQSAARFVIKTVAAGFPLEYEERPFEWQKDKHFEVRRVVRKGLTKEIENRFRLEPIEGGGTRLSLAVRVVPKSALLRPIMALQVKRSVNKVMREFAAIDAELQAGHQADFSSFVPNLGPDLLARACDNLRREMQDPEVGYHESEVHAELAERLIQLVQTAPDPEIDRLRPFELADRWGTERRELLEVCLCAVNAGLLELSWDLVCPSCRTGSERLESLVELSTAAHCQFCDIDYELELDRAVEATFSPAAGVRSVDVGPYCIGGPARTPHVLAQAILHPQGVSHLEAPPGEARYQLFVRGGSARSLLVRQGAPKHVQLNVRGEAFDSDSEVEAAPGADLEIHFHADNESHIKLESLVYRDQSATAHVVSTLEAFRRRFAAQLLRPGLSLKVGRVALLFTDLTDSTAMYSALGDARAFRVVLDHFDVLREAISEHEGTVVKTIGDAVMAAFVDEGAAIRCAVAMHRAMPQFRDAQGDATGARLKVGVYSGPCYSVNANNILDYFGQSVNIAARLQGKAGGGEVVLTEEAANKALQHGWLAGATPSAPFLAELKGVSGSLSMVRVLVDG